MSRDPMPTLEFRAPLCPICDNETESDGDSYWCEKCVATWDDQGYFAEWGADDTEQCQSRDGRFLPGGSYERTATLDPAPRCVLAAGHAPNFKWGHHSTPGRNWTDKEAATPEQLAAMNVSA